MTSPSSLRTVAASLDAFSDAPPTSMRELAGRIRWEDGWQGTGPLSVLLLLRTFEKASLREALQAIGEPPTTSVREAYERLRFPIGDGVTRLPDGPISLRNVATRVQGHKTVPLRFLSYNTYLLQGLQVPFDTWVDDVVGWDALDWFGIPFGGALLVALGLTSVPALALAEILKLAGFTPSKVIAAVSNGKVKLDGVKIKPKPALEARATELGPVVAQYDVSFLCEVWSQDVRDRIGQGIEQHSPKEAWQSAAGPDESGDWTLAGSGLLCMVKAHRIARTEKLTYAELGARKRDTDAWSHKGALLTVVETTVGSLEVYQTHFYYGGGIDPLPGPTGEQRTAVWDAELAELSTFYRKHHDPANVAIITGDFNINGADVRGYGQMRRTMDAINMSDIWSWDVFGQSPCGGRTCRFTDGDPATWDRMFPEACQPVERRAPAPTHATRLKRSDAHSPQLAEASPLQPDCLCADEGGVAPPPSSHPDAVGRYDYVFVERPTDKHRYRLEVSRIRRRPFPRAQTTDNEPYLSDHLGLDLTLYLSPR